MRKHVYRVVSSAVAPSTHCCNAGDCTSQTMLTFVLDRLLSTALEVSSDLVFMVRRYVNQIPEPVPRVDASTCMCLPDSQCQSAT